MFILLLICGLLSLYNMYIIFFERLSLSCSYYIEFDVAIPKTKTYIITETHCLQKIPGLWQKNWSIIDVVWSYCYQLVSDIYFNLQKEALNH